MIKADWGVYITCSVICAAVIFAVAIGLDFVTLGSLAGGGLKVGVNPFANPLFFAGQVGTQFIYMFVILSLIGVGVRHAMGNWPTVGDLFLPFKRFGRSAATVLVYMVPAILLDLVQMFSPTVGAMRGNPGLGMLSAFSGIYLIIFLIWLFISGPMYLGASAAMFSDMPVLEAYKQGFMRPGAHGILLSILVFVASILSGLGAILCCVGVIFTFPIVTNVVALHYIYYFPSVPPADVQVPATPAYETPSAQPYQAPVTPPTPTPAPTPEPTATTEEPATPPTGETPPETTPPDEPGPVG